ncbi:MAG: alpha/beta hydrolase [Candidatus Thermoplasmatota archaeon]|nr:alpha/beta hydrolase [Candidatus Thermoplasmatota archaeon]
MAGKIIMTSFVLVPGAWLGGWVWKKVTPILEKEGHRVFAVTLTGMGERVHLFSNEFGIETTVRDVQNIIRYNDLDDVVLVGHSFAAKVVASVADKIPERTRLVIYLDTFQPEKIRTPQQSFQPNEFGKLEPGQTTVPFTDEVLKTIGKDVLGADKEWMNSFATPWPLRYATDPITLTEKFDKVKGAHIFCTRSGIDVNEIIAGKWGKIEGNYRIIESAHFPMVTKPEETARALIDLSSG